MKYIWSAVILMVTVGVMRELTADPTPFGSNSPLERIIIAVFLNGIVGVLIGLGFLGVERWRARRKNRIGS